MNILVILFSEILIKLFKLFYSDFQLNIIIHFTSHSHKYKLHYYYLTNFISRLLFIHYNFDC